MYYLAVCLLPPTGEPELYCTSFVRGSTTDDGSVEVELQNGTFRFLEQSYTSVFVSCNCLVKYLLHIDSLHFISGPQQWTCVSYQILFRRSDSIVPQPASTFHPPDASPLLVRCQRRASTLQRDPRPRAHLTIFR